MYSPVHRIRKEMQSQLMKRSHVRIVSINLVVNQANRASTEGHKQTDINLLPEGRNKNSHCSKHYNHNTFASTVAKSALMALASLMSTAYSSL